MKGWLHTQGSFIPGTVKFHIQEVAFFRCLYHTIRQLMQLLYVCMYVCMCVCVMPSEKGIEYDKHILREKNKDFIFMSNK